MTSQCSKTLEVEGVAGEVELPRPVMADMISNILTLSRNVLLMDASCNLRLQSDSSSTILLRPKLIK